MQTWTCRQCGATAKAPKIILPIRCACGLVDRQDVKIVSSDDGSVSIVTKAVRLGVAVDRWIAAGSPERTDEQVDEILRDHCSQCLHFKDSRCQHLKCGCQVRSSVGEKIPLIGWLIPRAMLNKLRMETEVCPDGKWS